MKLWLLNWRAHTWLESCFQHQSSRSFGWRPLSLHDFFDIDDKVWARGDGSASFQQSAAVIRFSCKQTVSNKSTGTYRFGIRYRQQHSVKTPSNPYQDRSQSATPERSYTIYLSKSTTGWVAGDHSTTVDHWQPPRPLSVIHKKLPKWPAFRAVWYWPWQEFPFNHWKLLK